MISSAEYDLYECDKYMCTVAGPNLCNNLQYTVVYCVVYSVIIAGK